MSWNYGMMNGLMDNEMISAGWYCLLFWQILISGGAFKQEGSGAGGGDHFNMCAETIILEGDESDGCSKKTPLYITRLVMFIFLEGLMLHVVCNPVFRCSKQRVKSFIICSCTWIES